MRFPNNEKKKKRTNRLRAEFSLVNLISKIVVVVVVTSLF